MEGPLTPFIGDPGLTGWTATAGYLAGGCLCGVCALRSGGSERRLVLRGTENSTRDRFLWGGLAIVMLLLGLNKQLDLQTTLIAAGKEIAKRQGWYDARRAVQFWFVVLLAIPTILLFSLFLWSMRRSWRRHWLTLLGVALLTFFVFVRTASTSHAVDFLPRRISGWWMKRTFELGGIFCIVASAAMHLFPSKKTTSQRREEENEVRP